MKNTRFFYSTCYPDTEVIEYAEYPIDPAALIDLVKGFDWNKELSKSLDYYSPSLDFVGSSDKHRFILSGLGEGQLEAFMAMYSVPNDEACPDAFDEQNYHRTDSYSGEISLQKAERLLQFFVEGDYASIQQSLSRDKPYPSTTAVVDREEVIEIVTREDVPLPEPKTRLTNPWEYAILREIERDGGVARNDDFWNEPEWTLAKIGQRIFGYGMFLFFLVLGVVSIWFLEWEGLFFVAISLMVGWVYIKSDVGILLEKRRRRRERSGDV